MGVSHIGIAPRCEFAYRALLRRYRWRLADLASVLAWPLADVREVIDELRVDDLVAASADDPEAVRAVEPRLALPALTVRRLRSPCGPMPAAVDVDRFIAEHERPVSRIQDGSPGEHDAVSVLVERMVAGVKEEVVMLVPDYVPGKAEFSPQVAATVLRRAGQLRAVWCASFLHLPPVVEHARWLGARGATPRTLERVPARIVIVDRTVAVVADGGPQANVARSGPLLDSYCQLADRLWERAVDVRAGRCQVPELDDRQRGEMVLRLLADGLTDDAIARRIGVSVRTVRTEVAALMAKLDARSRFQAGLRAAQLGLVLTWIAMDEPCSTRSAAFRRNTAFSRLCEDTGSHSINSDTPARRTGGLTMYDLSRSVVPEDDESLLGDFDTGKAHPARVYDHLLGGKDNFASDREASMQMLEAYPDLVVAVRANRAFLGRTVRYLSDEAGIRQFLDIGTGIPSANNTHEAAQAAAPESRVVYVDNDPMVLAHARALLRGTSAGTTAYLQADLRNVEDILGSAAGILDFSKPVGVMLLAVLHYIPDSDDPYGIVSRLMAAVPPGSHLVISHAASDINADELAESVRRYNQRSSDQSTPRSHADVSRFFAGLELMPPGLTSVPEWRPSASVPAGSVALWGGVGRKNA